MPRILVADIPSVASSSTIRSDVTTIKLVGDIHQRSHYEAAIVSRECGFDALLHSKEWQGIFSSSP